MNPPLPSLPSVPPARIVVDRSPTPLPPPGSLLSTIALLLAALPVLALVFLHLLGARHDVGFLSGTRPAYGDLELASGFTYTLCWFTSLTVSPIIAIAVAIDRLFYRGLLPSLGRRWRQRTARPRS